MPEPTRCAHVAMLVRNPFTHDTRVEKEARTLIAAGYRVTVVADAAAGLPDRESRDGIDVRRIARSGPPIPGLRYVVHEARLARVLRALRADVYHAHDSNTLIAVAWAARAGGVPFVYDAHDLWLGRPRRERSRAYFALSQALYTLVERWLVPRAAAGLTVSPPIARHLERRYRLRRMHLVPNYPELPGHRAREDLRSLPGGGTIAEGGPLVLYLGGLMAGRGLEQLVDAVGLVADAQLVMLGQGPLRPELVRRAASLGAGDRLHLLPPVPPDGVVAYAASADIGVSPIVPSCLNYRYSLPNKLFQYMAAGIPVVASDFPQVREVVESAGCGVVVDTSRPSEIARAIERIAADPVEARAMGGRGRAAVDDRYNWDSAGQALLEVYRGL
ncbi:MAG: glycosyltransferase family 4 protein [Candidatus Limnocylindria bacterium]